MSADPRIELRQLFPERKQTAVVELTESLNLVAGARTDRPYTVVNFVASADGHAAFHSRSGALSNDADRALFHGLRERVDAVFTGTNTIRAERYGRLVRDPERRARRTAAGLAPDPLACVMTRSGDVPTEIPMFDDPDSRIALFTPIAPNLDGVRAQVQVVRVDRGELTLTTMLRRLRADFDVRALLCEGGPTVFGAMLQERLVDELFLTIAPRLAGGGMGPAITSGPELPELAGLELVSVHERDGALFLRYAIG